MSKDHLSVYLADFKFVTDQMHVRMRVIVKLVSLAATYLIFEAGFFLIEYSTLEDRVKNDFRVFLVGAMSLPFMICSLMMIREDILMQSHDLYLKTVLRPQIINAASMDQFDGTAPLGFVESMEFDKTGTLVQKLLSGSKYLFCLTGMLVNAGALLLTREEHSGAVVVGFIAIIIMIALIVLGIGYIGFFPKFRATMGQPTNGASK